MSGIILTKHRWKWWSDGWAGSNLGWMMVLSGLYLPRWDRGGTVKAGRGLGFYMEVGCNRRRRGEEPVAIWTASMELARLAGEPLTVGKEVSLGEAGSTSSDDSKLRPERDGGEERERHGEVRREWRGEGEKSRKNGRWDERKERKNVSVSLLIKS